MLNEAAPSHGVRAMLLLLLATMMFGACTPDGFLASDEERERNFQRARDAERLGDFEGAADFYERALERNPRAANVTLGYAGLCEVQLKRYAHAAYLYERYVKLFPEDPRKVDILRRVTNCIERLAVSVPVVIRSETIARDLEAVRSENQRLRGINSNHVSTIGYWSNEWRRVSTSLAQASPSPAAPANASASTATSARAPASAPGNQAPASKAASSNVVAAGRSSYVVSSENRLTRAKAAQTPLSVRTHSVAAGETLERIARRYGVTARAIQQANPGVSPRRMPAGTVLRIPTSSR